VIVVVDDVHGLLEVCDGVDVASAADYLNQIKEVTE